MADKLRATGQGLKVGRDKQARSQRKHRGVNVYHSFVNNSKPLQDGLGSGGTNESRTAAYDSNHPVQSTREVLSEGDQSTGPVGGGKYSSSGTGPAQVARSARDDEDVQAAGAGSLKTNTAALRGGQEVVYGEEGAPDATAYTEDGREGKGEVIGRQYFTVIEDQVRVIERVTQVREHIPVEKEFVVEERETGRLREMDEARKAEHLGVREREVTDREATLDQTRATGTSEVASETEKAAHHSSAGGASSGLSPESIKY